MGIHPGGGEQAHQREQVSELGEGERGLIRLVETLPSPGGRSPS
jgi:hypothetical protein